MLCKKAFAADLAVRLAHCSQHRALLLGERVQWAGFPLREENGIRRRGSPWPSNRLLVFVYWATRQVCLSPPSPFSFCLPVSRPGRNEGDWGRINSYRAGGRSCCGSCSAALPRVAWALFPCLLRAESARTRRPSLFIFKANSVPPRRAAGPGCAGRGRGVSDAQWRGLRTGPVSGLCCLSLVPMG